MRGVDGLESFWFGVFNAIGIQYLGSLREGVSEEGGMKNLGLQKMSNMCS